MEKHGSVFGELNSNIKKQIIESVDSIKTKIKHMREIDDDTDVAMKKILKPVTEPLQTLIEKKIFLSKQTGF